MVGLLSLVFALPAAHGAIPDWSQTCWSHPTPASGNASPVQLGDQVCFTLEPTTLRCLAMSDGTLRWQATHDVVDTLDPDAGAGIRARLDALPALQASRQQAARDLGLARRAARSHAPDPEALAEANTALRQVQQELDALEPYLTPPDKDLIGYASPTPVTTADSLFALFGQGVVSRHDLDGTVRWSVWLGAAATPMRGFDWGSTASPVLADGVLVVAHGRLRGLSPTDGRVLWEGPEWRDYGTPTVVATASGAAVATAAGALIRAADGAVLGEGLGDVWYTSPAVEGDRLFWLGGHGNERSEGNLVGTAWRIGDGAPEPLWSRELGLRTRLYGDPLLAGGQLWLHARSGELIALDPATGATTWTGAVTGLDTEPWVGPRLVDGELVLTSRGGGIASGPPTTPFAPTGSFQLGDETRSAPLFVGARAWVRTLSALTCYGR